MQVQRGFHRIGVAGLVLLCVLSLPFFAFALYAWLRASPYDEPGIWTYEHETVFLSGAIGIAALASGGLWYLASWTLGWIAAGFRD